MMGPSRIGQGGRDGASGAAVARILVFALVAMAWGARAEVGFNRDVRPIMSETCFKCHGPATRKAGLRLDVREGALRPLESKKVPIVPGRAGESEIIRRIFSTDDDELMPPPKSHKVLTEAQKEA